MSVSDHIEESAELYALGTLDAAERKRVDEHVRICETCAARIGDAEATIEHLVHQRMPSAELDRRMRARFVRQAAWPRVGFVAAAAFLIGLLPSLALRMSQPSVAPLEENRQAAVRA